MITEIKEKLRNGVVTFTFTKKDGTTRQAKGTLIFDKSIVGDNFVAPTGRGSEKIGATAYWDLDKEAWRSFNDDSLVSIDKFIERRDILGGELF